MFTYNCPLSEAISHVLLGPIIEPAKPQLLTHEDGSWVESVRNCELDNKALFYVTSHIPQFKTGPCTRSRIFLG